jgi:Ca2+-dependent lipid-binding protein
LELFDWNQVEQAKSLGIASIDLTELEPFLARERTVKLSSSKFGDKGEVRVRLLFQPEIIAKARKNTSTFSTAGRAMTQIGGLPVGAGKGVFHGVTGAFRKIRTSDTSDEEEFVPSTSVEVAQPTATQEALGLGHPSAHFSPSLGGDRHPEGLETGTLKVTVIDASGLSSNDWKPYAIIRVGDKEHKTKHVGKTATPEW